MNYKHQFKFRYKSRSVDSFRMGAGMHLGIGLPRGSNFIFVPNTVHRKKSYFACRLYIVFTLSKIKKTI
jgi:hypothetical protein